MCALSLHDLLPNILPFCASYRHVFTIFFFEENLGTGLLVTPVKSNSDDERGDFGVDHTALRGHKVPPLDIGIMMTIMT